jgi:hypothetical protein
MSFNCGNRNCGYRCVQASEKEEKERTRRIESIAYAIRDFAKEGVAHAAQYKALDILEKVLKKEDAI